MTLTVVTVPDSVLSLVHDYLICLLNSLTTEFHYYPILQKKKQAQQG